jgi:uncharacterized Rmd1/YagE family protein
MHDLYNYLHKTYAGVSLSPPSEASVIYRQYGNQGDIFYFKEGSVVCWGTTKAENEFIIQELKPFEVESVPQSEVEHLDFVFGPQSTVDVHSLVLSSREGEGARHKLAFSYALHQSVKLAVFEERVDSQMVMMKTIPQLLSRPILVGGRQAVKRKLSELLSLRGEINLHSQLVSTPDLFWEEPELEGLYKELRTALELLPRASVLNSKLDHSQQLVDVLRTQLSERYSARLEWLIIILILLNVVYSIISDSPKYSKIFSFLKAGEGKVGGDKKD